MKKWKVKHKEAAFTFINQMLFEQTLNKFYQSQLFELLAICWYGNEIDGIGKFDNWERFNKGSEQWYYINPKRRSY